MFFGAIIHDTCILEIVRNSVFAFLLEMKLAKSFKLTLLERERV